MTTDNTSTPNRSHTALDTITGYLSFIATAGATTPTSEGHAQQLVRDIYTARERIYSLVDALMYSAEAQLVDAKQAIGNSNELR